MKVIAHPLIILVAVVMYAVEFFADKIPFVDNLWDSIHTIVRPAAGAAMGYFAGSSLGPVGQTAGALLMGSVTASSHLTKATTRVTVNSVPGANIGVSLAEDGAVAVMMYFILKHPIIAGIIVILFIIFAIWFLRKMFHLLKKVFGFFLGRGAPTPEPKAG